MFTFFIEPFNRGIYVSLIFFLPELPTCRCRQFVEGNDDVLHFFKHYAYKKGMLKAAAPDFQGMEAKHLVHTSTVITS
jgi:hypothetical protein